MQLKLGSSVSLLQPALQDTVRILFEGFCSSMGVIYNNKVTKVTHSLASISSEAIPEPSAVQTGWGEEGSIDERRQMLA